MRFYVLIILLLCSCGEKATKSDSQSPEKGRILPKDPAKPKHQSQKPPKDSQKGEKNIASKTKVPKTKPLVPPKAVDPSLLKSVDALDKKEFFNNVVGMSIDALEKKYKTYLESLTDEKKKDYFADLSLLDDLSIVKVTDKNNDNKEIPLSLKTLFEMAVHLEENGFNNSQFGFPLEVKDNNTIWFVAKEMRQKLDNADPGIKGLIKETIKTPTIDEMTKARILQSIRVKPVKPKDVLTQYEAWFDDKAWFKHSSNTYEFIKKSLENFEQDVKNDIQTIAQQISDSITKDTPGFDPLVEDELYKLGFRTKWVKNEYTARIYAEALDILFKGKTRGMSKDMLKNNAKIKTLYDQIDNSVADDLFEQMTTDLKANNLEEKLIKPLATILVEVTTDKPILGKKLFDNFFDKKAQRNNPELNSMYVNGYINSLRALLIKVQIKDSVLYNMSPDIIIETGRNIQ